MDIWVGEKERRKKVINLLRKIKPRNKKRPIITGTIDHRRNTVLVSYPEPQFQVIRTTPDGVVHVRQQY